METKITHLVDIDDFCDKLRIKTGPFNDWEQSHLDKGITDIQPLPHAERGRHTFTPGDQCTCGQTSHDVPRVNLQKEPA